MSLDTANMVRMANAIRALSMDAVQAANSGHPGMPMGMADVATVLWGEYLKHDPKAPDWADRDRFVLSAGHGSMLIYSLLHLAGYASPTMEDIRNFRQLGSPCAGHPENFLLDGVECTTGPLGQGPHLGDRGRRMPDGGHQPRSDRPCRAFEARPDERAVGR